MMPVFLYTFILVTTSTGLYAQIGSLKAQIIDFTYHSDFGRQDPILENIGSLDPLGTGKAEFCQADLVVQNLVEVKADPANSASNGKNLVAVDSFEYKIPTRNCGDDYKDFLAFSKTVAFDPFYQVSLTYRNPVIEVERLKDEIFRFRVDDSEFLNSVISAEMRNSFVNLSFSEQKFQFFSDHFAFESVASSASLENILMACPNLRENKRSDMTYLLNDCIIDGFLAANGLREDESERASIHYKTIFEDTRTEMKVSVSLKKGRLSPAKNEFFLGPTTIDLQNNFKLELNGQTSLECAHQQLGGEASTLLVEQCFSNLKYFRNDEFIVNLLDSPDSKTTAGGSEVVLETKSKESSGNIHLGAKSLWVETEESYFSVNNFSLFCREEKDFSIESWKKNSVSCLQSLHLRPFNDERPLSFYYSGDPNNKQGLRIEVADFGIQQDKLSFTSDLIEGPLADGFLRTWNFQFHCGDRIYRAETIEEWKSSCLNDFNLSSLPVIYRDRTANFYYVMSPMLLEYSDSHLSAQIPDLFYYEAESINHIKDIKLSCSHNTREFSADGLSVLEGCLKQGSLKIGKLRDSKNSLSLFQKRALHLARVFNSQDKSSGEVCSQVPHIFEDLYNCDSAPTSFKAQMRDVSVVFSDGSYEIQFEVNASPVKKWLPMIISGKSTLDESNNILTLKIDKLLWKMGKKIRKPRFIGMGLTGFVTRLIGKQLKGIDGVKMNKTGRRSYEIVLELEVLGVI